MMLIPVAYIAAVPVAAQAAAAVAGKTCDGSPMSIGAWQGDGSTNDLQHQTVNIFRVSVARARTARPRAEASDVVGWIFKARNGELYFQSRPGSTLIALDGVLTAVAKHPGFDPSRIVAPLDPLPDSTIADGLPNVGVRNDEQNDYYLSSCFASDWDGVAGTF